MTLPSLPPPVEATISTRAFSVSMASKRPVVSFTRVSSEDESTCAGGCVCMTDRVVRKQPVNAGSRQIAASALPRRWFIVPRNSSLASLRSLTLP